MSEPVGTIKTGNTEWTVRVEGHRFTATAPGFNLVSGDTWGQMENNAKVQASKAKVKVAVPYVEVRWGYNEHRVNAPRLVQKTATGINAGTGNVTYRDERGSAGQETYGGRGLMKPFSPEDEAEYLRLLREIHDLEVQRDKIANRYRFGMGGLKQAVQDEIDAEHKRREEANGS